MAGQGMQWWAQGWAQTTRVRVHMSKRTCNGYVVLSYRKSLQVCACMLCITSHTGANL